jgi:DHA1 family tetracycline resistance protein-like MFS transporter
VVFAWLQYVAREPGHLIIPAIAFIVLGEGLFDPSYNARLSTSVPQNKQGLLQGTNQSIQALYHVLVPLAAGAIYTYSHGSVFGIAAVLMVIGLVLFSRLKPKPIPAESIPSI